MGGGKRDGRPFAYHFVAGTVGGSCGLVACFPFDTAKTYAQMNKGGNLGTFGLLSKMISDGGFLSIYKGILYPVLGYGAIFSVNFGVKGTVQDILKSTRHQNDAYSSKDSGLPAIETMFCGMCAGAASSFVRTPIERIKCWSQIHQLSTIESTKQLVQNKSVYHGLFATMSRDVPRFAVYYPIYQTTRGIISMVIPNDSVTNKPPKLAVFLSGGMAGIGCYCTVYPLDAIKTRIQASASGTYSGNLDAARAIWSEGGVRAMYRGLLPTCYRAGVLHSCIFLLYENVLNALDENFGSKKSETKILQKM